MSFLPRSGPPPPSLPSLLSSEQGVLRIGSEVDSEPQLCSSVVTRVSYSSEGAGYGLVATRDVDEVGFPVSCFAGYGILSSVWSVLKETMCLSGQKFNKRKRIPEAFCNYSWLYVVDPVVEEYPLEVDVKGPVRAGGCNMSLKCDPCRQDRCDYTILPLCDAVPLPDFSQSQDELERRIVLEEWFVMNFCDLKREFSSIESIQNAFQDNGMLAVPNDRSVKSDTVRRRLELAKTRFNVTRKYQGRVLLSVFGDCRFFQLEALRELLEENITAPYGTIADPSDREPYEDERGVVVDEKRVARFLIDVREELKSLQEHDRYAVIALSACRSVASVPTGDATALQSQKRSYVDVACDGHLINEPGIGIGEVANCEFDGEVLWHRPSPTTESSFGQLVLSNLCIRIVTTQLVKKGSPLLLCYGKSYGERKYKTRCFVEENPDRAERGVGPTEANNGVTTSNRPGDDPNIPIFIGDDDVEMAGGDDGGDGGGDDGVDSGNRQKKTKLQIYDACTGAKRGGPGFPKNVGSGEKCVEEDGGGSGGAGPSTPGGGMNLAEGDAGADVLGPCDGDSDGDFCMEPVVQYGSDLEI